ATMRQTHLSQQNPSAYYWLSSTWAYYLTSELSFDINLVPYMGGK
ncbi:24207_t:CDS:1, partial [Gigaspora margarita]